MRSRASLSAAARRSDVKAVNPLLFKYYSGLPMPLEMALKLSGMLEVWSRGDVIPLHDMRLVSYGRRTWLEAHNMQNGANSTEWFERRAAAGETALEWFGTRGKPAGYMSDTLSKTLMEGDAARLRKYLTKKHAAKLPAARGGGGAGGRSSVAPVEAPVESSFPPRHAVGRQRAAPRANGGRREAPDRQVRPLREGAAGGRAAARVHAVRHRAVLQPRVPDGALEGRAQGGVQGAGVVVAMRGGRVGGWVCAFEARRDYARREQY